MPGNKANKSTRVGDELFIVESSNAEFKISDAMKDTAKISGLEVDDELRRKFGGFWTKHPDGKGKQVFFNKITESTPVEKITFSSPNETPNGIEQELKIEFRQGVHSQSDFDDLLHFFNKDTFDEKYYDHATIANIYEEGNNVAEQAAGLLNLYAEIKSDYNFLEKKYETFTSETNDLKEYSLPNFYNFMFRDSEQAASVRKRILTLGNRISVPDGTPPTGYYRKWVEQYPRYSMSDDSRTESDMMKNIAFTKKEMEKLSEIYKYKEMFPMFNTIEFNVESDGKFGTTLEETNFSSQLRSQLTEENSRRVQMAEVISNMGEKIVSQEDGQDKFRSTGLKAISRSQERITYDVDSIMNKYKPRSSEEIVFNDDVRDGEQYRAFYNLMSIITKGRVEKIKKLVFRNYEEVLEGKTAYNEPIFYQIEKRDEDNNLLQTFNFTNMEDLEKISFVDTQVKYNTRYRYVIKSLNLVIGTEYGYTQAEKLSSNMIGVSVSARPSAKIIEVPLFEKSVIISDNPPIAPEMLIIPFRAVNDRIRFFFNSAVGRYKAKPILFSEAEENVLEKYKQAQDIPSEQEEIMFETDDSVSEFVLYRMSKEPTSYQDFQDLGKIVRISTSSKNPSAPIEQQIGNVSSASFDDKIEPNKKYYYCLRAIDYHQNISYPSPIYEFEMVDDSGSIYPVSRIYEIKKPETKQAKKGVRRFIHIKPSLRNLLTDREKMNISEENGPDIGAKVHLGIGGDLTWGKKFKLRLTSKSTGKKIDFNFSFDVKQNESIIED